MRGRVVEAGGAAGGKEGKGEPGVFGCRVWVGWREWRAMSLEKWAEAKTLRCWPANEEV